MFALFDKSALRLLTKNEFLCLFLAKNLSRYSSLENLTTHTTIRFSNLGGQAVM